MGLNRVYYQKWNTAPDYEAYKMNMHAGNTFRPMS